MSSSTARALEPEPDHADAVVAEIRDAIRVEMPVMKAARTRRNHVKRIAGKKTGHLRTYNSGSVAHGTAKNPLPDADCGLVLDRRTYPELGPDGNGFGPNDLIDQIVNWLHEELVGEFPGVSVEKTKRAIKISFNEPIDDEDPTVDLIVALTRAGDQPGLWIPNTKKDDWDASDPEEHTRLLTAIDPRELRAFRAKLIRLAKVAVGQDEDLWHRTCAVISFNLEALALLHVREITGLAEGLCDFFRASSGDIANCLTPDPAGVSPPIKLPEGMTHDRAATRLGFFADCLDEALEASDDAAARKALAEVFPRQLPGGPVSIHSQTARTLHAGNVSAAATLGLTSGRIKNSDAYGDVRP